MVYDGGTAVVRVIADAKGLTQSIQAQTKSAGRADAATASVTAVRRARRVASVMVTL